MIEKVLRDIGLTAYEAKAYLALLDLGKATSGEILKKAELRSGKIYEILDSLENKGLVSEIKEGGVRKFSPADPRRVLDYLEEKSNNLESQKKEYTQILPELIKKINFTKPENKIEVFIGINAIKSVFVKELDCKGQTLYIFGVLNNEFYQKAAVNFFVHHGKEREKKRLKIKKILSNDAKKHREYHEKSAQIRYLPYVSSTGINVIGNLSIISIFSDNPVFIVIEDKNVAESFKEQFKFLWSLAKQ